MQTTDWDDFLHFFNKSVPRYGPIALCDSEPQGATLAPTSKLNLHKANQSECIRKGGTK